MVTRPYRAAGLAMLILHLTACHSWAPATTPPRQLIEEERPSTIRVTRSDGTELVVQEPRVENDSIASPANECQSFLATGDGQLVCATVVTPPTALVDVSAVEVRQFSWTRALLFAAAAPVVYVVVALSTCGDGCR